ncbi:MAG: helix-turn-helix domain-containing protein [Myxococcales bacterium]|nr:helix-turn-helix domain-containing protein [Myxococcales bacterium]
MPSNNVQRYRESLMMSKAELARKAGLSSLTIDRVEAGRACRLDTKRKILLALGMKVSDKAEVFGSASDPRAASTRQTAAELSLATARSLDARSGSSQEPSQASGGYES